MSRPVSIVVALLATFAAILPQAASAAEPSRGKDKGDIARYILPPGNFGGVPFTDELDRPAPALQRR